MGKNHIDKRLIYTLRYKVEALRRKCKECGHKRWVTRCIVTPCHALSWTIRDIYHVCYLCIPSHHMIHSLAGENDPSLGSDIEWAQAEKEYASVRIAQKAAQKAK